jgi:hypothetical protein
MANLEAPDNLVKQGKCRRFPELQDHQDPPGLPDNQEDPVNPEEPEIPLPVHPAHPEMLEPQDNQELPANQAARERTDKQEARVVATTAHPHALRPGIRESRNFDGCSESIHSYDVSKRSNSSDYNPRYLILLTQDIMLPFIV